MLLYDTNGFNTVNGYCFILLSVNTPMEHNLCFFFLSQLIL